MQLLFAIAACCCVVLVGAAAALWWSIQKERVAGSSEPQTFREAMQKAKPVAHPRMDLAAGVAAGTAGSQNVRGSARRRGLSLDFEAEAEKAGAQDGITNRDGSQFERRDRAYFNEDMGDLSDPDLRRAPAGGVRRPLGTISLPESR